MLISLLLTENVTFNPWATPAWPKEEENSSLYERNQVRHAQNQKPVQMFAFLKNKQVCAAQGTWKLAININVG